MRNEYDANRYMAATRHNGRLVYAPRQPKFVWTRVLLLVVLCAGIGAMIGAAI